MREDFPVTRPLTTRVQTESGVCSAGHGGCLPFAPNFEMGCEEPIAEPLELGWGDWLRRSVAKILCIIDAACSVVLCRHRVGVYGPGAIGLRSTWSVDIASALPRLQWRRWPNGWSTCDGPARIAGLPGGNEGRRRCAPFHPVHQRAHHVEIEWAFSASAMVTAGKQVCLLYTSDAADE